MEKLLRRAQIARSGARSLGLCVWSLALVALLAGCSRPDPGATARGGAERGGRLSTDLFSNAGFETGDAGAAPPSWTVTSNRNTGGVTGTVNNPPTSIANLNLANGGTDQTFVVQAAADGGVLSDPDVPAATYPLFGKGAVLLNFSSESGQNTVPVGAGKNSNTLSQTMTVTSGDVDPADGLVHIRFAVEPVLENPGHTFDQQPYYFVLLRNNTKGVTVYSDFNGSGQAGVPWQTVASDLDGFEADYLPWGLVNIAPGPASLEIGDSVTLTIVASGCVPGGHWGRVYVDAIGPTLPGLFVEATGPSAVNAGSTITYSMKYSNGGSTTSPSDTTFSLVVPTSTTFKSISLAGCTTPAVGATGTITCPVGAIAAGSTTPFTVVVTVPAATAAGTIIRNGDYQIASASAAYALLGPKVKTTVTTGTTYADLSIALQSNVSFLTWGETGVTYTVTASNAGPAGVTGATVTDALPVQLTGATWTCVGTAGGSCAASGSGSINDGSVNLPSGASVTYTVTASVQAGTGTATVNNLVTVAAPAGTTDPSTTNNSAFVSQPLGTGDTLTVTKNSSLGATITSSPSGISCGVACTSASGSFIDGSSVVLTVAPTTGWTFSGWTGACASFGTATSCTVTMAGATSVGANFIGPPATVTVSGGGTQSTAVNTAFGSAFAVVVKDVLGDPLSGVIVTFTPPSSGPSVGLSSATAVTNASGVASVTGTANGTPGTYTLSASVSGVSTAATFALTNLGPPASIAVVSGTPQTATVGTAFGSALVVVVKDAAGDLLPNTSVSFSAPGSGPSAGLGGGTAITGNNGQASITATANGIAGGPYSVTATVNGKSTTFSLTNTAGAAAAIVVTTGSPQSAVVNTAFAAPLGVTVEDAFGNGVAGVTVAFVPPVAGASAGLTAPLGTTDGSGRVSTAAFANTVVGSYAVVAQAAGIPSASFALTNLPGAPASLTATSGGGQSITVNTAGAPLVVTVRDAFGNPIPGAAVTFTAPASGASATFGAAPVTNAAGQTSITPTADSQAGGYTITASIGGLQATFSLTNVAGAPASLTVSSGSGQSTTVGTAFGAPLVALLKDASGNPISGTAITFTAPASGASAVLAGSPATTTSAGLASVTATANTVSGTYSVTASVSGLSATFTLTNKAGAPASIAVSSGSGQSATVGTAFAGPLVVVVKDADGNVVPGATVTFSAPGSGATASLTGTPATTSAAGLASVTATAGSTVGSYSVTATVGGISTTFSLTNTVGAAASITLSSGSGQSATVGTPFGSPIVALVRDALNNPVAGASVTFAPPGSGATAVIAGSPATTNASGLATVTATAGTVAGTYAVVAATGALQASATLTNTAGAPASIAVSSGSGQSAAVGTAFGSALVAVVKDADGNVVPGVSVTFSAPGSGPGAVLLSSPATTTSSGLASVTATANLQAGTYSVTASVGGASATFTLTNTAGAAASLTVVSGSGQSATVNTAFGAPLVVLLKDAQGNPVPGASVAFTPASGGASAAITGSPAATSAAGLASVTATANGVVGGYNVVASFGALSVPLSLTNTAGAAAKIAIVSGDAQTATVTRAFAAPLVALVTDAANNPVQGALVSMTDPAGGATATLSATAATTDAAGHVSLTAVAGTVAGPFQVTFALSGTPAQVSFSLTNLPGAPVSILIVPGGTPQSATESTPFAAPLAVEVVDAFGNPVPGATVTFAAPASGATAALSGTTATSGANGQTSITATAGNTAGTYAVTATLPNGAEVNFTLTNLAGAPATITAVSGAPASATVATAFAAPLVARVSDSGGNPVAGATVTFGTPTSGATASLSAATGVTDASGLVQVQPTAGTVAGKYTITASVPGAAAPALFELTNTAGPPSILAVSPSSSPQSTPVSTAFPAPLVVTVTDAFGNPISGLTVTFAPPATGATAILAALTATTDASGRVSVGATASATSGTYSVLASVAGVSQPATFQLTNTAGSVATIVVKSGSGQSATVATAFGAPLVALVTDSLGNPVTGAVVRFTPPGSAPTAVLGAATATTDGSGLAQVTATAGQKSGSYTVVASLTGAAAPAVFSLSNTAAAPASITAAASSTPQTTAVSTVFAQPLMVTVMDTFGNGVPGVTVTYAPPATGATASLSANSPATQGDGTASVVATASATAGSYAVTASVSGVSTPAAFALTNTSGAPASVAVASGGGQTTMVTTAFPNPLVVTVKDGAGNPIPGAALTVTLPAAGASAAFTPASPVTDATGSASISLTANATPGTYSVSLAVAGGAAPATASLTNTPIPTTTTLSASSTSPVEGTSLTLTATVTATLGAPTGNVEFFAGTTSLGQATIASGAAILVTTAPAAGTYSVTATYPAQGSFDASTSNTVTLTVLSAGADGGLDGGEDGGQDAGDAGEAEAGPEDGGPEEAGPGDAGAMDATVDAGGSQDSGAPDTGNGTTGPSGRTITSLQGGGCTCSLGAGAAPGGGERIFAPVGLVVAMGWRWRRRQRGERRAR